MNGELIWVLSLLAVAVVLFATGKVRMDAIALLVIVAFVLSDTLTLSEASPALAILTLFLLPRFLLLAMGWCAPGSPPKWALAGEGCREQRNQNAGLFDVNRCRIRGVYELDRRGGHFIPVVLSVSMRMNTSPSRLMMPLSFAGLISGMMTTVATPPNWSLTANFYAKGCKASAF